MTYFTGAWRNGVRDEEIIRLRRRLGLINAWPMVVEPSLSYRQSNNSISDLFVPKTSEGPFLPVWIGALEMSRQF